MNWTADTFSSHRRYRTVTLDMGFTLVDLRGNFAQELVRIGERAGLAITPEMIRAAERRAWQDQEQTYGRDTWEPSIDADSAAAYEIDRRICVALGICDADLIREANEMSRAIFEDASNFHVYPEVFPALESLRSRGVTLGIVSNWGWRLPELCETLGLAPYFDFILTSARVGAAKPHPAIFRQALACAGSAPESTLHVGDSLPADVLGAQQLGITGVLLDRTCEVEATANYPVVCGLDQLPSLL